MDVLSVAKIFGILYVFIGFIVGGFISILSLAGAMTSSGAPRMMGALFGVGSIIFFPIFYGVLGFVGGAVMTFLYNLVSSWVGGIEIETE